MNRLQHVIARPLSRVTAIASMAVLLAALSLASTASAATPLVGTFKLAGGVDTSGGVAGSYFRMIQPGGTVAAGPFVSNGSSPAGDKTYTFLSPGTDGGLVTGGYQPQPSTAFDGSGNSLAAKLISPTGFFAVDFAAATAAIDPQTATAVAAPAISDDGAGNLSGDLRAFGAAWNNQNFNQGSPKPDGTSPGLTAGPTGTRNPTTGAFVLEWTSLIVGGPFNGFTGKWHLTGVFVSASGGGGGGGGGGSGGDSTTPLVAKLVRSGKVATTTRFNRKAKRFTVDTGYSFSNPAGEPAVTVSATATALVGSSSRARKAAKRVVAKKSVTVGAGATARVKFTLNKTGARELRSNKRLRIRYSIRAKAGSKVLTATGASKLALK